MALEQGRAGEVGLGDEAAGGLECGVVFAAAARGGSGSAGSVKVADSDGSTSLSRLLAGIDWVARRGDRGKFDVHVMNLAFGAQNDGSYRSDPLAYEAA